MKIIELRAQNVKRLSAVQVTPDGSLVVIGGKNGQGKSSLLDSIVYALSGASSLPGRPVRQGEERAEIEITLDSEPKLVIRRRIDEAGKTDLEIKQLSSDGVASKVTSPQKLLDSLCGTIAFDPLAFTRLRPQDQVDMLRKVVGVDVSDLDADAKRIFDERTGVNRDAKALESQVAAAPKFDDAPAAEVSAADILAAIEDVRRWNDACDKLDAAVVEATNLSTAAHGKAATSIISIADLKQQIKLAEQQLEAEKAAALEADANLTSAKASASERARKSDDELKLQLTASEETNRKVRANIQRAALVERYKAATDQTDGLTKQIDAIRAQRIKRLSEASWPVEGLGFSGNGVTFGGLPFEQCSSAEQLRISTAIGVAQNPKLRVWMIRDGSLLDEENLAAVGKLAEEHDAQIWIERVGKGEECSVIIEDGAVLEPQLAVA